MREAAIGEELRPTFYVEGPDGSRVTASHESSGSALAEATRHFRPRLVERRNSRRNDWEEMKLKGYRIVEELNEPPYIGDKVIELLIMGGFLDRAKAAQARAIIESTLNRRTAPEGE